MYLLNKDPSFYRHCCSPDKDLRFYQYEYELFMKKIKKSEEKFGNYFDQLPFILLDIDPNWYHKFISPSQELIDYYKFKKRSIIRVIWNSIYKLVKRVITFQFWG